MIEGSFRKVETSQKQCRNPGCHLQDEEVADVKNRPLRLLFNKNTQGSLGGTQRKKQNNPLNNLVT